LTQADPTGMHDWHSSGYVEEWITGWDGEERRATLRRIPQLIPHDPDETIRVLDVGGGWGPITRVVLESFPKAQVVLQDFSEPMLNEARERLAAHGDALTFVQSDLMAPNWTDGLKGPFDAVVSSLAIHNVRFPDRIRAIYQEIFPLVAPGGCFINLDQIAASEIVGRVSRHAQQMAARQRIFEETGEWKSLSELPAPPNRGPRMHAHGTAASEDLERIAAHEPATLANQLRWLLEAGFDEVDCFVRDGRSGLLGAYRAS
jgi:tRNA (cmo5U34)-methyltransferase